MLRRGEEWGEERRRRGEEVEERLVGWSDGQEEGGTARRDELGTRYLFSRHGGE